MMSGKAVRNLIAKLLFAALVASPFWWVNGALSVSVVWAGALAIAVLVCALSGALWEKLPYLSPIAWRVSVFAILLVVPLLVTFSTVQRFPVTAGLYAVSVGALYGVSTAYWRDDAAAVLAFASAGVGIALLIANLLAGVVLRTMAEQPSPSPGDTVEVADVTPSPVPEPTSTPAPSPTPDPDITPEPTATPEPERPIAGFGYLEYLVDNGEAEWTHLTGYGPRVNSVAHATMYDADGSVIYDTMVAYNSKGYRGPEVSYDKPDNVYRILIIGDSFVEAIQIDYERTFYALLQDKLAKHDTTERRYEVIAMGRTGWGTLHETIYYQVEGYRYNADLVILMFYINDVVDNYPIFFYPNINNTNFEFIFEDDSVQIVDTNQQPLPPNSARRLYNELPPFLQRTNLARLFVRMGDPPVPVVTPGGILTRVHPQYLIYVTEPEVEGYEEAWKRTERGLKLLANNVDQNGGRLVVMPIFLGKEMVLNVSNWWPELIEGWQWDDGLPEKRLASILDGLPAELVETRPVYEAYAEQAGAEVYNLMYIAGDGHFSDLGHQLTCEAIYGWLVEQGIVEE